MVSQALRPCQYMIYKTETPFVKNTEIQHIYTLFPDHLIAPHSNSQYNTGMQRSGSIKQRISSVLLDDNQRYRFQFLCVYGLLALISGGMTIVNILTHKGALTWSTLIFAVLCAVVFLLLLRRRIPLGVSKGIFVVSFYLLLTFFIVTGNPDGFSILWVCLLPACGLLTFGRKGGTLLCLGMLAILLFFLETPWGLSLLQYEYSPTFRMRFPLLYTAFYFASLLLESIRMLTHKKLVETQELYRYLYAHDALTKLYNRHGFNERMDSFFTIRQRNLALIILDIDHFKMVNDLNGHLTGDAVLQSAGNAIACAVGERGFVCRWGGEEFAVLIPNCTDLASEADSLLNVIRALSVPAEGGPIFITVSVGAALVPNAGELTAVQLVNAADACLYRAKERGRDRAETCSL